MPTKQDFRVSVYASVSFFEVYIKVPQVSSRKHNHVNAKVFWNIISLVYHQFYAYFMQHCVASKGNTQNVSSEGNCQEEVRK